MVAWSLTRPVPGARRDSARLRRTIENRPPPSSRPGATPGHTGVLSAAGSRMRTPTLRLARPKSRTARSPCRQVGGVPQDGSRAAVRPTVYRLNRHPDPPHHHVPRAHLHATEPFSLRSHPGKRHLTKFHLHVTHRLAPVSQNLRRTIGRGIVTGLQGWQPDPSGRYASRYFEAGVPTPWVSDGNSVHHCPLPPQVLPLLPNLYSPPPGGVTISAPGATEQRAVGWYRNVGDPTRFKYWDGVRWIETGGPPAEPPSDPQNLLGARWARRRLPRNPIASAPARSSRWRRHWPSLWYWSP